MNNGDEWMIGAGGAVDAAGPGRGPNKRMTQ